jgi:hypothetical protein
MLLNSVPFIKSYGIRTVSSTWTASLALSADALVFCIALTLAPLGQGRRKKRGTATQTATN